MDFYPFLILFVVLHFPFNVKPAGVFIFGMLSIFDLSVIIIVSHVNNLGKDPLP